eukprot:1617460-Amphidinium_carterae.1
MCAASASARMPTQAKRRGTKKMPMKRTEWRRRLVHDFLTESPPPTFHVCAVSRTACETSLDAVSWCHIGFSDRLCAQWHREHCHNFQQLFQQSDLNQLTEHRG